MNPPSRERLAHIRRYYAGAGRHAPGRLAYLNDVERVPYELLAEIERLEDKIAGLERPRVESSGTPDDQLGATFCAAYGGIPWDQLPREARRRLTRALTAVRQYLEVRDERGQAARECADAALAAAQTAHAATPEQITSDQRVPDLDASIDRLEVAVARWLALNPQLRR